MVLRDFPNLPSSKLAGFSFPQVYPFSPEDIPLWRRLLQIGRFGGTWLRRRSFATLGSQSALLPVQQCAVMELGQRALSYLDLVNLFQETVETVAQTLQVPYCRLWQVQSDGKTLRSRAQTGWPQTEAGAEAVMDARAASQILGNATGAMRMQRRAGGWTEQVLPWMPQDSASGLGVVVFDRDVPLGFLEIYTRQFNPFHAQEALFLQAVGQVLATAIIRKRTEELLVTQGHILGQVVAGVAISEIFHRLCLLLEAQLPGSICSILQVDGAGDRLYGGVAPSMPRGYQEALEALDSLKIEETALPCGLAVRRREAVFVNDIAHDPAWEKFWTFAQQWQIHSCWSMPFLAQTGEVLGTFVVCHPVVCAPTAHHRQLMSTATDLASLVVEQEQVVERLQRQALYDSLTGLCNRIFFIEQLRQNFQVAHPCRYELGQGETALALGALGFAVLFLDVDHFKVVNDSLGHTLGDELLVAIARRVERCLRRDDTFARLGGDEFAILLKGVDDVELVQAIADRIKAVLSFPFQIGDREVFTSVSVGIVHSDNGYQTPEEILRDADIAMYRSKAQGRCSATVFDKTMHAHVLSRLQIETALQQAVQDLLFNQEPQFELHYQPIISLITGKISGFEALLRWTNPDLGRLSPLDFIPIAEETGLIVPLGRWVLQAACAQLRRWQSLPGYAHLTMSVNVSSRQFIQPEFISDIHYLLQSTQVPPTCLKLEITESVLMETVTAVMVRLEELREIGICLSLDDFGTGYSSLSYLQRFPINTLKVDRSFVQQLETGQEEIVRAIVALAHGLKMDAVAEGIETAEQLTRLKSLGCEFGQGYLFSAPAGPAAAEQLLIDPPNWIAGLSLPV